MKRTVHYKEGYKIVITNKFYEVSDGKTLMYFGESRKIPTVQEVWSKTIGLLKIQEDTAVGNRRRSKTNN